MMLIWKLYYSHMTLLYSTKIRPMCQPHPGSLSSHKISLIYTVFHKVPTFKLSVTLSHLNQFSKFSHCWKAYEICYKPLRHYPLHLRHVATLPWEIKKIQIFCKYSADMAEVQTYCILITFNFVDRPQILIFSVFKIASLSSYWFQIKVLSKSCPRRLVPRWLLTNTSVTSAVTNFRCTAKVNK